MPKNFENPILWSFYILFILLIIGLKIWRGFKYAATARAKFGSLLFAIILFATILSVYFAVIFNDTKFISFAITSLFFMGGSVLFVFAEDLAHIKNPQHPEFTAWGIRFVGAFLVLMWLLMILEDLKIIIW